MCSTLRVLKWGNVDYSQLDFPERSPVHMQVAAEAGG